MMTNSQAQNPSEKSLAIARLSAPVSCTFEPVGRWYEAFVARRQHSSSSHISSGSKGSSSESNEDEDVSSDEEDDSFVLMLDPRDWKDQSPFFSYSYWTRGHHMHMNKFHCFPATMCSMGNIMCYVQQQDHYKVLGLEKLRYKASVNDIKRAFKKKVLKHHPDKKKSNQNSEKKPSTNPDYFTCITKANDILSNRLCRRAYDSIDPDFDNSIPSVSESSKSNFFTVFGPVFERNSRWSTVKPVPPFGDENSSLEDVDNFYSFWYDFNSWREFSYLDEEDKTKGESREERRWMEKQNKAMRQKRKKDEVARIRSLVDNAYNCDPRIKWFREKEKERKIAEKKAKEEAARAAAEEKEKQRLEALETERIAREKEEQENKEKALIAKKQKEKLKNAAKKERKTIRTIIKNFDYFVKDEAQRVKEMESLDRLLETLALESLQEFRQELENSSSKEQSKLILDKKVEETEKHLKEEAEKQEERRKEAAKTAAKTEEHVKDDWTEEQSQLVIKAANLFPAGTVNRWKVIADYINMHSRTGSLRNEKLVIKKVKALQRFDPSVKDEVNKKAYAKFDKEHAQKAAVDESKQTLRYDGELNANGASGAAKEKSWSSEEQKLLEGALRKFPTNTPERWDKIAEVVPGRTKKECMKRYKELVEMVKAKKAAQAKTGQ